jgi:hypothetical protein
MAFAKRYVSIRPDQAKWLEDHPEINVSGLLQKCLDKQIANSGE